MKTARVDKLLAEIDEIGMPHILVQTLGFMMQVKPDSLAFDGIDIKFYKLSQLVCLMSTSEDMSLHEQIRPANMIIRCRKCYAIHEKGRHVGYLFWPEEESRPAGDVIDKSKKGVIVTSEQMQDI